MAGKGKSRVPANETEAQAFVRLAENRTGKALKALKLIGNCASYQHTDAQAEKIIGVLTAEVQRVKAAFSGSGPRQEAGFKL